MAIEPDNSHAPDFSTTSSSATPVDRSAMLRVIFADSSGRRRGADSAGCCSLLVVGSRTGETSLSPGQKPNRQHRGSDKRGRAWGQFGALSPVCRLRLGKSTAQFSHVASIARAASVKTVKVTGPLLGRFSVVRGRACERFAPYWCLHV